MWESVCKGPGKTGLPALTEIIKWSAVEAMPQPLATAPNCLLSPQALCTVNPSQTLLCSNFTCLSPKITSPLLCSLTFAGQHPQDSHLPISGAITYSTDLNFQAILYPFHQPSHIPLYQLCLLSFSPSYTKPEVRAAKALLLLPPSSYLPPFPPWKHGASSPHYPCAGGRLTISVGSGVFLTMTQ